MESREGGANDIIMKGTEVQTLSVVDGAWAVDWVRGNYYTHAHR